MKKSLVTSSFTQKGKKATKTTNFINPDTKNAQLAAFAQMVNALTTNNYITADVVTRRNVLEADEESGSQSSADGKTIPALALNDWDYLEPIYFASISYAGDGVIDTTEGTIVGGILAVLAPDGNFSGFLTATGTDNFAPAKMMFSHVSETRIQEISKPVPTLTLGEWNKANDIYTATITYDGDGDLSTSTGAIIGGALLSITDSDGSFDGIITASEGEIYAASSLVFNHRTEEIAAESSTKTKPTLAISEWTAKPPACNAFITYDGDGELTLSVTNAEGSTITDGGTLIVNDVGDALAYGVIRAAETDNFEAAELSFCYNGAVMSKTQPTLTLGSWSNVDSTYTADISYNGDGSLSSTTGTIANNVLTVISDDGIFNGVITASEGQYFAATGLNFYYTSVPAPAPIEPVEIDLDDVFTDGTANPTINLDDVFTDGEANPTIDLDYVFADSASTPRIDLEDVFTDGAANPTIDLDDVFADGASSTALSPEAIDYIFNGGE